MSLHLIAIWPRAHHSVTMKPVDCLISKEFCPSYFTEYLGGTNEGKAAIGMWKSSAEKERKSSAGCKALCKSIKHG